MDKPKKKKQFRKKKREDDDDGAEVAPAAMKAIDGGLVPSVANHITVVSFNLILGNFEHDMITSNVQKAKPAKKSILSFDEEQEVPPPFASWTCI